MNINISKLKTIKRLETITIELKIDGDLSAANVTETQITITDSIGNVGYGSSSKMIQRAIRDAINSIENKE